MNNPKKLSYEEAIAMLPKGNKHIHTFTNIGPGFLVGSDWPRGKIKDLIRRNGAELAGEAATRLGHGLAVRRDNDNPLFIETRKEEEK